MKTLWGTRKSFLLPAILAPAIFAAEHERQFTRLARSLLAAFLSGALACGSLTPAFAQNPPQSTPQSPAQNPPPSTAPAPQAPAAPMAPVSSLGLATHDFSRGPRAFPDLFRPYRSIGLEPPLLTNSPRIDQLIHDGKLSITLQDAVELALENSLDIAVQRYYPWTADTDILKTAAGSFGRGTPGASLSSSTANLPSYSYDPLVTSTVLVDDRSTPVNNPLISGTGTVASAAHLITHTDEYNTQASRGFETGSSLTVNWNNTRSSSTSTANFFNPAVQSTLSVVFSQQLLNGFGLYVNRRNILISKNNRKIADWAFAQQAITTVTSTITAYWELVYARENVKVEQQAVATSTKLYGDNQKQLAVGTMSPLDVTTAKSELATDRQNLIVAQTVQLQDEQILKNAISKDPMAANLVNVEIIPTDQPTPPAAVENPSFEDSVKEAYAKRPELQEQQYNIQNGEVDVRATRNALLPQLTVSAQYSSVGLSGNSPLKGAPTFASSGVPIVDANGVPIPGLFEPTVIPTVTGTNQQGFGTAQSDVFHNRFPDYSGQLTLNLPLRNRSAQADNARALLVQRQLETQMQQLKNAALLDVRNSYIALTQDRAQVEAASEARALEQETFDDEQKKYRLGASTVYNVILIQRDLITAEGTELRALANLQEAKANYERALGRTLEVNHVTIADALTGEVERETLIPGTLHGKVVGTENLFRDSLGQ